MSRRQHTKNSIDDAFGGGAGHQGRQAMSSKLSGRCPVSDGADGAARFLMSLAHADVAFGLKLLFNHAPLVVTTRTVSFFLTRHSRRWTSAAERTSVRLFLGRSAASGEDMPKYRLHGRGKKASSSSRLARQVDR
jgi:phosphoenolpyruvate carboxykinase (ATP)